MPYTSRSCEPTSSVTWWRNEPQLDRDVVFGIRAKDVGRGPSRRTPDGRAGRRTIVATRVVELTALLGSRAVRACDGWCRTADSSCERLHAQIATMNRSDSTTQPSGISMRTGPCTITGPAGTTRTMRSITVAHALSALITTSSSSRRPGSSLPVSSSHCARADSTGPNGIHCHARISASRPQAASAASVFRGSANSDCTSKKRAADGEEVPHRCAKRVENESAVVACIPRARRSDMRRQWQVFRGRVVRNVGRIADHQVVRPEFGCARP